MAHPDSHLYLRPQCTRFRVPLPPQPPPINPTPATSPAQCFSNLSRLPAPSSLDAREESMGKLSRCFDAEMRRREDCFEPEADEPAEQRFTLFRGRMSSVNSERFRLVRDTAVLLTPRWNLHRPFLPIRNSMVEGEKPRRFLPFCVLSAGDWTTDFSRVASMKLYSSFNGGGG